MNTADISWLSLFIGSLVLIIPIAILQHYKTGLLKPMIVSLVRMTLQLLLVGLYLQYIFSVDSILINLLWLIIMMVAATATIIRRCELKQKYFILPVSMGIIADVVINCGIFALIIVGTEDFFNARYLIPIAGMVIGNCITSSIIGIRSFYQSLAKEEGKYQYAIMSGASVNEATFPYIAEAIKTAFGPTIASNATIGLIWLPGMMTGQILGGSDPIVAIKYQIMIVVAIFAGSVITFFVSVYISKSFAFDKLGKLNLKVFRNEFLKSKK